MDNTDPKSHINSTDLDTRRAVNGNIIFNAAFNLDTKEGLDNTDFTVEIGVNLDVNPARFS